MGSYANPIGQAHREGKVSREFEKIYLPSEVPSLTEAQQEIASKFEMYLNAVMTRLADVNDMYGRSSAMRGAIIDELNDMKLQAKRCHLMLLNAGSRNGSAPTTIPSTSNGSPTH